MRRVLRREWAAAFPWWVRTGLGFPSRSFDSTSGIFRSCHGTHAAAVEKAGC